jgi:hypothetical protein
MWESGLCLSSLSSLRSCSSSAMSRPPKPTTYTHNQRTNGDIGVVMRRIIDLPLQDDAGRGANVRRGEWAAVPDTTIQYRALSGDTGETNGGIGTGGPKPGRATGWTLQPTAPSYRQTRQRSLGQHSPFVNAASSLFPKGHSANYEPHTESCPTPDSCSPGAATRSSSCRMTRAVMGPMPSNCSSWPTTALS